MQTSSTNHSSPHDSFSAAEAGQHIVNMPGPARLFARIAESMTTYIRAKNSEVAHGSAMATETFVQARWMWAILPLSLLILTLLFVVVTAVVSARKDIPVWKSHSLPALVHGLDDATCMVLGASTVSLGAMEKSAARVEATNNQFGNCLVSRLQRDKSI